MNFIKNLLPLVVMYSCASTQTVYKKVQNGAKIDIADNKGISVFVTHLRDDGEYLSGVRSKSSKFAARSFESILLDKLQAKHKFKIFNRATSLEAFSNLINNQRSQVISPDYIFYITYDERSDILPYSRDNSNSKVYSTRGHAAYKIVKFNGEVLQSGSLHKDFQKKVTDYLYVNNEQVHGDGLDDISVRVRNVIASKFIELFFTSETERAFKFKAGNSDKFSRVIDLVSKERMAEAIKLQETILKSSKSDDDISDSNYNLALLYLMKKDKLKAKLYAEGVKNGFIEKDFNEIHKKINEI